MSSISWNCSLVHSDFGTGMKDDRMSQAQLSWQSNSGGMEMRGNGWLAPRGAIILATAILTTTPAAADDAQICEKASGDVAIAACSRAISAGHLSGHRLAVTHYNRAIEYANKGDQDRALSDYGEAIRLDPKYAPAYNARGNAWIFKGDIDRAIADYNQAVQLDPKFTSAYNGRGNAWVDKGDFDRICGLRRGDPARSEILVRLYW
jgi:tetratricopeptide (TPR) repeat protein